MKDFKVESIIYCIIVFVLLSVFGCSESRLEQVSPQETSNTKTEGLPSVTTIDITSITTNSAISGGTIVAKGEGSLISAGVCYGKTANPTVGSSTPNDYKGATTYTSLLVGLEAGTRYYIRAYAKNELGIAYGVQKTFETLASSSSEIELPVVTTTDVSAVTSSSATCGGLIVSAGNGTITSSGVCWSKTANPTVNNSTPNDYKGVASFSSLLTRLEAGTTYYVRAYVKNEAGTAYGVQKTFKTLAASSSFTLDGIWYTESGKEIEITGTVGVYLKFNTDWQKVADAGLVSLGDASLKNITKISEGKYSCQSMWAHSTNYVWDKVDYSTDGVLTLSADATYFEVVDHSPFTGNKGSFIMYRK